MAAATATPLQLTPASSPFSMHHSTPLFSPLRTPFTPITWPAIPNPTTTPPTTTTLQHHPTTHQITITLHNPPTHLLHPSRKSLSAKHNIVISSGNIFNPAQPANVFVKVGEARYEARVQVPWLKNCEGCLQDGKGPAGRVRVKVWVMRRERVVEEWVVGSYEQMPL